GNSRGNPVMSHGPPAGQAPDQASRRWPGRYWQHHGHVTSKTRRKGGRARQESPGATSHQPLAGPSHHGRYRHAQTHRHANGPVITRRPGLTARTAPSALLLSRPSRSCLPLAVTPCPSARWCLQECDVCREGGRVLKQESVAAFVAVQLGTADARCDVDAVVGRCDPVVVAVANQDWASDRAQPAPSVMTFARLELGLVGGHGGWILLILPSGRHPLGNRPI